MRTLHRKDLATRVLLLGLLAGAACTAPPSPAPAAPSADAGARPDLNAPFRAPDMDVEHWVAVFEAESREIAAARAAITDTLDLQPGQSVADIGAGTGLFMADFAAGVGAHGSVFEVDISPRFVAHLRERAAHEGLAQVRVVQCTDRSAELPQASVDVVFVCDTYHHFEHPGDTLASLHRALRPGGRLVIVDFDRVPGTSRDWVLEHVRAGRQAVIDEIEEAGFALQDQPEVAGLHENYVLRFRRR